jgi:succinate dehydrogenase/fumarate reductase flavoprotein subunit
VDFLNTGPAVSKTLRAVVNRMHAIRKTGDLLIIDLVRNQGEVAGAVGLHLPSGTPATIAARATVLATGGLTRLYRRNSASANMGGDGYALALRAGAALVDMEFVQFFPIGHLAPRLIGMDPIMWDPFRYKLGGRLLNSAGEEFTSRYGVSEDGRYLATRDIATHAIIKEVEAGRGSPHGGAYLSFQHVPAEKLREAFGPVIDRLARNGIDLTRMPVEVAPIAHYHMGGVTADVKMQTEVPGLQVRMPSHHRNIWPKRVMFSEGVVFSEVKCRSERMSIYSRTDEFQRPSEQRPIPDQITQEANHECRRVE